MHLKINLNKIIHYLDSVQLTENHEGGLAGEFPMCIRSSKQVTDFNFLNGYTLLHLCMAWSNLLQIDPKASKAIEVILKRAASIPSNYQNKTHSTSNWYRPQPSGYHFPSIWNDWPNGVPIDLCDDLDDTAISMLLKCIYPFELEYQIPPYQVFKTSKSGEIALRPKANQRLKDADLSDGVYLSWRIPSEATGDKILRLPIENSVELLTVSNIYTAINLCYPQKFSKSYQEKNRIFINNLSLKALNHLLVEQDAYYFEFLAPYYPRAPFAAISFLLRNHFLNKFSLLNKKVLDKIVEAVFAVQPSFSYRNFAYTAKVFWLNSVAWCLKIGLISFEQIQTKLMLVYDELVNNHLDSNGEAFHDFIFFLAAHVGDYSGRPYANAVMIESLSMLYPYSNETRKKSFF